MIDLPGPSVGLLNAPAYVRDPVAFFEKARQTWGKTFLLKVPIGEVVVTADPEGVREVFSSPAASYGAFSPESFAPFINPRSLPLLEGEPHLRMRKLLTPPLHGPQLRAWGSRMQAIADGRVAQLAPGQTTSLLQLAHGISTEVIIRTVFGVIDDARVPVFLDVVRAYTSSMKPILLYFPPSRIDLFGLTPWGRYLAAKRELVRLAQEQIDAGGSEGTVLDLLLAARDEAGQPLSRDEVLDQLVVMLFAGQETTAIGIAWTLHALRRRPEVESRLREELATVPDLDPDALHRLPFLDAVCQETLRLWPVAALMARKVLAPITVRGVELPVGAGVAVCPTLLHSDPDLYADPGAWRPERHLERKYGPYELIPFGGGHRRCIGAAFAAWEMKNVLAVLVARHKLTARSDAPVRQVMHNFVLGPEGDIPGVWEGRR